MKFLSKHFLIKVFVALTFMVSFTLMDARGQQIKFKNYSTMGGLTQSSVVTIFQDDEGFLWFGTYGGLNRFDGYNFKKYQFNIDNPKGISHNHVRSICQDTTGVLWVATVGGLNRFFTHTEEFVHFKHDPLDSNSISDDEVYKVFKDKDGVVWVGTFGKGLDRIERIEGVYESEKEVKYRFIHHKPGTGPYSISNERISSIDEGHDGTLWIGSFGLNNFDKKTGRFKAYWHEPNNPNSLSNSYISALCVDKKGYVWAGTWGGGLNRLDPATGDVIRFEYGTDNKTSVSHNIIMSLYCDRAGNIWVATWGGGLNKVEPADPNKKDKLTKKSDYKITWHQHSEYDLTSISGNSIYSIFEDKTGMMWVGTDWNGVNKFENTAPRFRHITTKSNLSNSIVNNVITAFLLANDGKLWIATQGGLNVYDKNTGAYGLFKHNPKDPGSLSNNHIRSLCQGGKDGTIWVGSIQGLNKYNPQTGKFKRYYIDPSNPGQTNNLALFESNNGMIYIGNYSGGMYRFNPKTEEFKVYEHDPGNPKSISNNEIWSIVQDKHGVIWVGTAKGGLCKFNPETEVFTSFQNNPDDSSSISSNHVVSLFIDHADNLWVGTTLGLNMLTYGPNGKVSFVRYTVQDGLSAQTINGIVEDSFNHLWLSTSQGLTRFEPANKTFTRFNVEDGLQDNEFSINAMILDPSTAEIYAGGINGFNVFHPSEIRKASYSPEVKIVDIRLFNRTVRVGEKMNGRLILAKTLSALDYIELSYEDKVISIEYAALHFQSPLGNQYSYILEGFDNEWNNVGNQRMATYTNLKPGEYIFRVKAANTDEVWSEEGAKLVIFIKPPIWKTLWFRIIGVVCFIAFLFLIYYLRVSQIERRNKYLEETIKKRTKEISRQNKILNENNLVLEARQKQIEDQSEELIRQKDELARANKELEEMNLTKDKFFSIIAHDLKSPFSSILGFVELLKTRGSKLPAERRNFYIDSIYSSSNKIYNLLENLLSWARTQTKRIEFKPVKTDISALAQEAINLLEGYASQKQIRISADLQPGLVCPADKDMVLAVFRNLVGNAIKYTPDSGAIKVKTEVKDGFAVVQVSDNGVGIPKERIDNLFLIDQETTTKGTKGESGTGLGLILCHEFIKRHNGKIWVKSKVNMGSEFTFTLPLKSHA